METIVNALREAGPSGAGGAPGPVPGVAAPGGAVSVAAWAS